VSKTIKMTRDGGHFWRAQSLSILLTWPMLPVVVAVMIIGFLNPLWFREWFLDKLISYTERYSRWRNYKVYSVYLGMDPKVWHTLKGDV
jgi:hypothetical protein